MPNTAAGSAGWANQTEYSASSAAAAAAFERTQGQVTMGQSEVSISEIIPQGRVQQHHTPAVHQLVFAKQCQRVFHLSAGAPSGVCDPVG